MEKPLISLICLLNVAWSWCFTEIPSFVIIYSASAAVHSCVDYGSAVLRCLFLNSSRA